MARWRTFMPWRRRSGLPLWPEGSGVRGSDAELMNRRKHPDALVRDGHAPLPLGHVTRHPRHRHQHKGQPREGHLTRNLDSEEHGPEEPPHRGRGWDRTRADCAEGLATEGVGWAALRATGSRVGGLAASRHHPALPLASNPLFRTPVFKTGKVAVIWLKHWVPSTAHPLIDPSLRGYGRI